MYEEKETGEMLIFSGLIDRTGYKKYINEDKTPSLTRHIWKEINERFTENRLSTKGKALYALRKEIVERSFADSKQNHGYRYAMVRGLEKPSAYLVDLCCTEYEKHRIKARKTNKYDMI